MTRYSDYEFYANEYGGALSEEGFNKEALRASAYIDTLTMYRIDTQALEKYGNQIKLATCAVIDVYSSERDGGEIASESVGSWSRSYSTSGKDTQARLYEAAETYLIMTGLLYRGAAI